MKRIAILFLVAALLLSACSASQPKPKEVLSVTTNPNVTEPSATTSPTIPTEPMEAPPTELPETTDPTEPTAPQDVPTQPAEAPVSTEPAPSPSPIQQESKPVTQPAPAPTQATDPATQDTTPGVKLKITTKEDTVILVGNTLQLEYTYTGSKPLTWSCSFPDIFTVDQNGVVTGVGGGATIVKVTDGDLTSRLTIIVQSILIHTPANTFISVGESLQIDYTYLGKPKTLDWSSSDDSVLTVDQDGRITGVGTGAAEVTVSDGYYSQSFCIYVLAEEDKTTSFDLQIDCPLYDGVTKFVGHYLQINHLNSHTRKANGRWSDIVDHWKASGSHTNPSEPDENYPKRNYYITSSNPDVVCVANKYDCGFYDDFLYFNKAGTAVITITSWDGYSESYTIHVKEDYDCAPGKTKLTPGEFAYYATKVGVEDGLEASYQIRSYLYIWYSEEELTWERAKSLGHANAKREFYLNSSTTIIVYAGFDESNGKHLFFHGSGEPDGKLEPYTPAGNTTGKIRFPSKSIDLMEKCLKLVEVLGDTSGGFVTYTSSDPSIVEASGSLLVAKHPGTATITATYKGADRNYDRQCHHGSHH